LAGAEELVRGVLNVPYAVENAGIGIGEHIGRAYLWAQQDEYAEATVDVLQSVVDFSTGFNSAASVAVPVAGAIESRVAAGTTGALESKITSTASSEVTSAGGGTTRLWRAVEPPELQDVVKYGDYNIHPNSTFKRFAFDEASLDKFIEANPTRSYTKTYIDIPTENLGQMYQHADPGGVGQSIGIDVYEHPEFYDWFDQVQILGGP
jgi:hypothetical protein